MGSKQQTALQTLIKWGDKMLKENPNKILSFSQVIDKAEELLQMEREQHGKTWDSALDAGQNRAWNVMRAYDDFDDYYNETYKGGKQ